MAAFFRLFWVFSLIFVRSIFLLASLFGGILCVLSRGGARMKIVHLLTSVFRYKPP